MSSLRDANAKKVALHSSPHMQRASLESAISRKKRKPKKTLGEYIGARLIGRSGVTGQYD